MVKHTEKVRVFSGSGNAFREGTRISVVCLATHRKTVISLRGG